MIAAAIALYCMGVVREFQSCIHGLPMLPVGLEMVAPANVVESWNFVNSGSWL